MGKNNRQRRAAKARHRTQARTGAGLRGVDGASFGHERTRTPRDEAIDLISGAMRSLDIGHPARAEAACAQLAGLATTTSGRHLVTTLLTEMITVQVTDAWQRGWQPADVHRLAGRVFGGAEQGLVGDAMAHELNRYAKASVEPRWRDQLSDISASTWWAADRNFLQARAAISDGGVGEIIGVAVRTLHVLATLPQLEALDPVPGTALPHRSSKPRSADVDEKLLSRVRMLLAKAESTPYEAEAETFTAAAQALMARHSIDAALLAAVGGSGAGDQPAGRRIGIDRPYERPKAHLLSVVADANRCRTVWSESLGFITVVGFRADLQAVETLFTSLLLQSTRAMRSEGSRTHWTGQSRTRAFRQSFLTAFAHRIGERLRSVTEHETAAAKQRVEAEQGGSRRGGELVRVLAQRSDDVDAAVEAMFPLLVERAVGSSSTDAEGWYAGVRAADQAHLFGAEQLAAERRHA